MTIATAKEEEEFLDGFFRGLCVFSYDTCRENCERQKEKSRALHAPLQYSQFLAALCQLCSAEKAYTSMNFSGEQTIVSKRFRKDIWAKAVYSLLVDDFRRIETLDAASSQPSSSTTRSPSEETVVTMSGSFLSVFGSSPLDVTASSSRLLISARLVSHLAKQLGEFAVARLRLIGVYERLAALGSDHRHSVPVVAGVGSTLDDVCSSLQKFHHPLLSCLETLFTNEVELLRDLLAAQLNLWRWQLLTTTRHLHAAHALYHAWRRQIGSAMQRQTDGGPKRSFWSGGLELLGVVGSSRSSKRDDVPRVVEWLGELLAAIQARFGIYFHDVLSEYATSGEMRHVLSRSSVPDLHAKVVALARRHDASSMLVVVNLNNIDVGTAALGKSRGGAGGYALPTPTPRRPSGLGTFPVVFAHNFGKTERAQHLPGAVMIISRNEETLAERGKVVLIYDKNQLTTYVVTRIEAEFHLVLLFEGKKQLDKDAALSTHLRELIAQLDPHDLFTSFHVA